jgi:Polyketide cyclase / dehydrase and lipid transport
MAMRTLGRILVGLVILLVLLAAVAFVLPREVSITRSTRIEAPPDAVFPFVNNLKTFTTWSPWQAMDPGMAQTFEGPAEGVGAKMTWDSTEVGSGTQEITVSTPNERVENALVFDGMAPSTAVFSLEPAGDGTMVYWDLKADMGMNPVARWIGVLFMDGWVGGDFERGLATLKTKVEGG